MPGICSIYDFCVYYQRCIDDVTDEQISDCHACGLRCDKCPQRLRGVPIYD